MDQGKDKLCNLCGLSCVVLPGGYDGPNGLLDARVSGGFESTPGNGYGALDDRTGYKFSLCEWCLDWLFAQSAIPPETYDYMTGETGEPFQPAEARVCADTWRKWKDEFFAEKRRRDEARSKAPSSKLST